jgi:hypothetical protein
MSRDGVIGLKISIHAPVKGATMLQTDRLLIELFRLFYFNPRTREGCDIFKLFSLQYIKNLISIHAPVKGATANSGGSD